MKATWTEAQRKEIFDYKKRIEDWVKEAEIPEQDKSDIISDGCLALMEFIISEEDNSKKIEEVLESKMKEIIAKYKEQSNIILLGKGTNITLTYKNGEKEISLNIPLHF